MDNKWWYVAGFFLFLSMLVYILGSCSTLNRMFNLPDDNPIEEAIEDFIEKETGLELDLTPLTPE